MKNIFKVLFLSILLVTIASCDNEDTVQLTLAPQGSGAITEPAQGTTIILNPEENQTNPSLTISWNSSSYGTPTEITYTVEVAIHGTDFESPFVAASTTNRYVTWNVGELNNIAVSSGLSPFIEGEIDIRIVSTVGTKGSLLQTSEPVTIFVTPFTTDLPKLAVPGEHQGWSPKTAPFIAASAYGETDYEGYMWLTNASDEGFKFVGPDANGVFDWSAGPDYGDDGTNTGKLVEQDESNCKVTTAGYYFVKADTDKLTYSTQAVNWAITGAATPNGWPSATVEDHDLTYDSNTKTLFINITMTNGEGWKFRGNNEWGAFEFGSYDADGYLKSGGDFTFDKPTGNYRIVLDLSNPRKYTFTVTPL